MTVRTLERGNTAAFGPLRDHPDISLEDIRGKDWLIRVREDPRSNIFHHPAWARLVADTYGFRPFVLAVRGQTGEIEAGIPLMETTSRLTGRRWIALPYSDHCRPISQGPRALERLVEGLAALPSRTGIGRLEVRERLPPHPSFRSYSAHVLHVAPLPADPDALLGRIQAMHRRNIATAEKRGVRIVRGQTREHVREFYRLHVMTRRDQGVPVQPRRFFDGLGRDLLERGLGFILLAYSGRECLAGAVFLHWQKTLTYKYGASRREGLPLRPNNLIFWSAMRWACENGFSWFDLGRTDPENTGLRRFKSGWGAEETALIYTTNSPGPGHPLSKRAVSLMEAVIRRSPRWVCRGVGELLYRHFP